MGKEEYIFFIFSKIGKEKILLQKVKVCFITDKKQIIIITAGIIGPPTSSRVKAGQPKTLWCLPII